MPPSGGPGTPDAFWQSRKALMEKDEETSDSSPSRKSVDDSEACSKLKCKFDGGLPYPNCKHNLGSIGVAGLTSSSADRPENHRLTRIFVDVVEEFGSGCFFCKDKTFCIGEANPMTVMICHQCEKEYHLGCLKRHGRNTEIWNQPWFCSPCCSNIHFALGSAVRNGPIVIHESQLGTLKRNEEEKQANKLEVQWQILGGQHQPSDLLHKVAAIFEDTFDPIMKGDRNILNSMVHGKSEAGDYFQGMYCAVLIIESVIISAGIFRIFGTAVAELPLVATLRGSQNKICIRDHCIFRNHIYSRDLLLIFLRYFRNHIYSRNLLLIFLRYFSSWIHLDLERNALDTRHRGTSVTRPVLTYPLKQIGALIVSQRSDGES